MIYFLDGESSSIKSLPLLRSSFSKCLLALKTNNLEYYQPKKETGKYHHQYEQAIRPNRHWLQKQQPTTLLGLLADDGKVVMYGCISGHRHHPHYLHRHHFKQQQQQYHHHRYYHYPHQIRQHNCDCIDAKCHQHQQRYPRTKTINTIATNQLHHQQHKQRKLFLNQCNSSNIERRTVMLIGSFTLAR